MTASTPEAQAQGDDSKCEYCNGTGQPGGIMGGPEHGLCSYCGGSGRAFSAPLSAAEGEVSRAPEPVKLHDWYAGQALAGMLAHSRNGHGYQPRDPAMHWHDAIAQEAHELAAAMLRAKP